MSPTTFIIIILVVVVAIVVFNYLHNRRFHHNPENLKKRIDAIFAEATTESLPRTQFLQQLKDAYSCTQKEATYLLGQAREAGFVTVDEKQVRIVK